MTQENQKQDLVFKFFSDKSDYAIKNLKEGQICFTPFSSMNDVNEISSQATLSDPKETDELKKLLAKCALDPDRVFGTLQRKFMNHEDISNFDNYRVFCTSTELNNEQMWGLYANSHHGFCVGYHKADLEALVSQGGFAGNVIYDDKLPQFCIDRHSAEQEQVIHQIALHKMQGWSFEHEFRAVYQLDKQNDLSTISKECLLNSLSDGTKTSSDTIMYSSFGGSYYKSDRYICKKCKPAVIYLGCRTDDQRLIDELNDIANQYDIKLVRMIVVPNSARLLPMDEYYSLLPPLPADATPCSVTVKLQQNDPDDQ